MPATRISFSYPQKMKDQLLVLAEKDCRSLSSYIQKVLAEHLENNAGLTEEKSEKTEKTPKKVSKKRATRRKRAAVA